MAEYNIGTTVRQEQQASNTLVVDEADLPTCVIGPLYQVLEDELADGSFDPEGETSQSFDWPGVKVGAEVDLAGVKNGKIDSQRKDLVKFSPRFTLVDGAEEHALDDVDVFDMDASGFKIDTEKAKAGLHRATRTMNVVHVDDVAFLYKYDGELGVVEVGDRMELSGGAATVSAVTDTRLYVEEDVLSDFDAAVTGVGEVTIGPSGTVGRVNVAGTAGDFSAYGAGDPVVVCDDLGPAFTSLSGSHDADGVSNSVDLTGFTFGANITLDEVEGAIVKVVNTSTSTTYYARLEAIDTGAGTMTVSEDYISGGAVAVTTDTVTVTIYESMLGYVESKNGDASQVTAVLPRTFSETDSVVNFFTTQESAIDIYPEFKVKTTFRAQRKDLAGKTFRVSRRAELLADIDETKTHYRDELGFAVDLVLSAQPNDAYVYYIPVDTMTDGVVEGYKKGIDRARKADVYMPVCLEWGNQAIDDYLETHLVSQSDHIEKHWRRGFFVQQVPLGEVDSLRGEIRPGQTANGLASGDDDGNHTIKDGSIDFVTGANVSVGDKVVVTYPEVFAGEYTALGTTTDNDLVLDGAPWKTTHEFAVDQMDVTTTAGVHVFDNAQSVDDGFFDHVEPGDYVQATVDLGSGSDDYRLRVVSVLADGSGFSAVDEAAGDLDTGGEVQATDVSIIRSWGVDFDTTASSPEVDYLPAVKYHIRPLDEEGQVTELVASKGQNDRRFSTTLDYAPTIQVGTDAVGDPIKAELSPALAALAVAAKRSGSAAHDPVTNLFLGAGIESVKWGTHFESGNLNRLAAAGFLLLVQSTERAEPKIRDMITSSTSGELVDQEELVVSNSDWQAKTLVQTYSLPDGVAPPRRNGLLLGRRVMNLDSLLTRWKGQERLRPGSYVISVRENPNNSRKTDITYLGVFPTAEKEIEVIQRQTV